MLIGLLSAYISSIGGSILLLNGFEKKINEKFEIQGYTFIPSKRNKKFLLSKAFIFIPFYNVFSVVFLWQNFKEYYEDIKEEYLLNGVIVNELELYKKTLNQVLSTNNNSYKYHVENYSQDIELNPYVTSIYIDGTDFSINDGCEINKGLNNDKTKKLVKRK